MSDGFSGDVEEQGWGQESRTYSRGRDGGGGGGRGGRGQGRSGAWGGDDRGYSNGGQQQWRDNRSGGGGGGGGGRDGGGGGGWRGDRGQRSEGGDSWGGQDDRSGGGRGDWGSRGRSNYGKPRYGDEESTTMEVPSNMVGKIIGRGGSKITELQSESCTRIQVTKEEHDDNTVIKLMGSEENMQKAKSLIEELISERRDNY